MQETALCRLATVLIVVDIVSGLGGNVTENFFNFTVPPAVQCWLRRVVWRNNLKLKLTSVM